jgi:hypothetical protein
MGRRRASPATSRVGWALLAAALGGCLASGPSELTVHNRTNVAIVFSELRATNGIAPCSSARFIWDSAGWTPADPGFPSIDPRLGGVSVAIVAAPMFDANARVAAIVTLDGVRNDPIDEVPALPPCAGEPPPRTPDPSAEASIPPG